MLKFKDDDTWLSKRIEGVKKAYKIPKDITGIAVDVGANVGGFPIVNHSKFTKIISIEPSQETYDKCVKNTSIFDNVEVYRYAVTDVDNDIVKLRSFIDDNLSGNASILPDARWFKLDDYEEVPSISLEGIYTKFNIDKINYLKVDIEAGEYDFLMNKDLSNIDYIGIEIHIHLGNIKMKELIQHIEKTHYSINSHGNGITSHYEITYKNRKL